MQRQVDPETLELECFTGNEVITGFVRCPTELRLIDALNSGERSNGGPFVHFVDPFDTGAVRADGKAGDVCAVSKSAIYFAAVSDPDIRRGAGANGGRGFHPFVLKSPVQVSLRLAEYKLTGRIHLCQGQTIDAVLKESSQFVPMTEVAIAREDWSYGSRPFVAVNREHVIGSAEEISPRQASR